MKKIISFLLVLVMIFAICGCGNQTKEAKSETVTDPTISISENVPVINLKGEFEKRQLEDGDNYKVLDFYVNLNSDTPLRAVGIYSLPKTYSDLLEEAIMTAKIDYPDEKEITPQLFDYFEINDGIENVYFAGFDDETFEDYSFNQAYFFDNGDEIIEIDFFNRTESVKVGDTNLQLFLPKGLQEIELSDENRQLGMCAAYTYKGVYDADGSELSDLYPNVDILEFDADEYTPEDIIMLYDGIITNMTEPKFGIYDSYPAQKEHEFFSYEFTSNYAGNPYCGKSVFILNEGKWIGLCFSQESEVMDPYYSHAAQAMLYGLMGL